MITKTVSLALFLATVGSAWAADVQLGDVKGALEQAKEKAPEAPAAPKQQPAQQSLPQAAAPTPQQLAKIEERTVTWCIAQISYTRDSGRGGVLWTSAVEYAKAGTLTIECPGKGAADYGFSAEGKKQGNFWSCANNPFRASNARVSATIQFGFRGAINGEINLIGTYERTTARVGNATVHVYRSKEEPVREFLIPTKFLDSSLSSFQMTAPPPPAAAPAPAQQPATPSDKPAPPKTLPFSDIEALY